MFTAFPFKWCCLCTMQSFVTTPHPARRGARKCDRFLLLHRTRCAGCVQEILFLCQNNGDYSSVGFVTAMPGQIGKWLPHDRHANINPYPPDRFADESSYPHDRHADKAYSPHSCNIQCLILSLQIKDVLCSNPAPCIFFYFLYVFLLFSA